MRILKLPGYFYPEQISSSHLSKDLNEAYFNAGFAFVNYVPTPTRGICDEVRKEYKTKKYEELDGGKVIVHRFSMFREGKNPIQRAIRYMLVNIIQYFKGSSAKDIDLILSGSTPPTQGLLCGLVKKSLSKKYGKEVPFVYNLQDVFPDSLVNAKMTKKGSIIWKIGRKIEDFTYRSADKIIVISEDIKKNIMDKGVPEEKIEIIPNWIDTKEVVPIERKDNALFNELNLDREKFYVTYAGNLGTAQGIDTIIETARLMTENTAIQFVLFGDVENKKDIVEQIKGLPNASIFPLQSQSRVSEVYSIGDLSIVACKKNVGGGAVPSKTFSIMATATPILLNFDKGTELWNLIQANDCGYVTKAGNSEEMKNAILCAFSDTNECRHKGLRGRSLVEVSYDKRKGTQKYVDVINSLVIHH